MQNFQFQREIFKLDMSLKDGNIFQDVSHFTTLN